MKREPIRFCNLPREVRLVVPGAAAAARDAEQARVQDAFERGRREGEKALSEQLLRQRADLLELQQGVLQSLHEVVPQLTRECEGALISLALHAAQKLVAGLPVSAEMVEAVVREALAGIEDTSQLTVLLHPDDLELLQRVNSPVLVNDLGGGRLNFQPGREVTQGGCIVQTRFGSVDARREVKLALLKKSLDE
jgi:flagellar assembly protein FliH